MSKNNDFLLKMAVVAGILCGTKRLIDECSKQDDAITFTKLLKQQATCDVLTEGFLKSWFLEKRKQYSDDVQFLVSKATRKNAKLFALSSIPKDLDQDHTFFQAIVTNDGNVLEVRIVSCATLSDELLKQFKNTDNILM